MAHNPQLLLKPEAMTRMTKQVALALRPWGQSLISTVHTVRHMMTFRTERKFVRFSKVVRHARLCLARDSAASEGRHEEM